MKKYQYIQYTTAVILLLSLFLGCNKILSPQIKGQIALDQLVKTQSGMITITNGMYSPLLTMYNGTFERLTDLASDDGFTWRNELEPDLFIATPSFVHTANMWKMSYAGIASANIILDHSEDPADYTGELIKNSIIGQARFMRAFYYFNLVRLFGGVPLILHEIKERSDAEVARSGIPEVYQQIAADLDTAEMLLPSSYDNSTGMETGRPTIYSAYGLHVLISLELEKWADVLSYSDKIIGKGNFKLLPGYADNFNGKSENGPGSLFEVQYSGAIPATSSGVSHLYAPSSLQGSALIIPTDNTLNGRGGGPSSGNGFVQAFESGDLRVPVILANYGIPNFIDPKKPDGSVDYVNKYYNTSEPDGKSSWNFPLIRYGEILLARSEALNEIGFQSSGQALDLLNQIRENAGLPDKTAIQVASQQAFREAVRQERRIELSYECKRYFDLNRWGILAKSIQPQLDYLHLKFPTGRTITHPVTSKPYYLYPIPASEFINNAKLGDQNPGYQ